MRIVVTGASGRLGSYLVDRLIAGGHRVSAWSGTTHGVRGGIELRPVDLTDETQVGRCLDEADPEAVIHAAAWSSADAIFRDPARGRAVNVEATRRLADWAASHERRILFTSTDLVFDGAKSWYSEEYEAVPILAYGRTKRDAEPCVLAAPRSIVARISLLFGPALGGNPGFYDIALAALARGETRRFFRDEFRTPLDYQSAAEILTRLIESDAIGIVHVGGRERLSRYELMRRVAIARGIDTDLIIPSCQADASFLEPRPADVSLDTTRLASLCPDLDRPDLDMALAAM
ncbi:MAG: SDR family oxidoreductase [Isosphaeraceae bacterium]